MKKILIIIVSAVLLIALGIGGYFYWNKKNKTVGESGVLDQAGQAAQKVTESATKGTLPSLQTNPLENKPDINPADKANPYSNIKTNPF